MVRISSVTDSVAIPPTLLDGVAAQDGAGAAAEGAVPGIARDEDHVVPFALVVLHHVGQAQVDLKYVGIVKMLRRLHDDDPRIGKEETDRAVQEIAMGSEVGVEDREQFALRELQSVVDVARLGVLVVGPADIAHLPLRHRSRSQSRRPSSSTQTLKRG